MIIGAIKSGSTKLLIGHMTKIAEVTGIPASTLQRWKREGKEIWFKNDYSFCFNTKML